MTTSTIDEFEGSFSLTFDCDLPVNGAVYEAGHTPNGYFWEGVATYVAPKLADAVELDCEASAFCAWGARDDLVALQAAIEPFLTDRDAIREVVVRAEAEGFGFDD